MSLLFLSPAVRQAVRFAFGLRPLIGLWLPFAASIILCNYLKAFFALTECRYDIVNVRLGLECPARYVYRAFFDLGTVVLPLQSVQSRFQPCSVFLVWLSPSFVISACLRLSISGLQSTGIDPVSALNTIGSQLFCL